MPPPLSSFYLCNGGHFMVMILYYKYAYHFFLVEVLRFTSCPIKNVVICILQRAVGYIPTFLLNLKQTGIKYSTNQLSNLGILKHFFCY